MSSAACSLRRATYLPEHFGLVYNLPADAGHRPRSADDNPMELPAFRKFCSAQRSYAGERRRFLADLQRHFRHLGYRGTGGFHSDALLRPERGVDGLSDSVRRRAQHATNILYVRVEKEDPRATYLKNISERPDPRKRLRSWLFGWKKKLFLAPLPHQRAAGLTRRYRIYPHAQDVQLISCRHPK